VCPLRCLHAGSSRSTAGSVRDSPRGPLKQPGNPHLKPAIKPKPNTPYLTMQDMAHAAKASAAHQAAHSKTPSNRYRLARGYAPPSGGHRPDRGGAPPSLEGPPRPRTVSPSPVLPRCCRTNSQEGAHPHHCGGDCAVRPVPVP
jgi:hypothetical protein